MSSVFVSYSRIDRATVTGLVDALRAAGEDVWVDLDDIVPSALWMQEIRTAIAAADSVLFVLSPHSAASEVCRAELDHAVSLSKRIVPVVVESVDGVAVPPPLPDISWLFLRPDAFAADVERLVEVLETDIARVHAHTRLHVRAAEWSSRAEDSSLLLRGSQLTEAERWLARQTDQKPTTTPAQARFIAVSRRAAARRQRGTVVGSVAIAAVMAVVATFAVIQWRNASEQRNIATEQRNTAVSRELATYAQSAVAHDPQLALILALRAYDSAPTTAARDAVRAAVRQSSVRAVLPEDVTPQGIPVTGSGGFDGTGERALAFGGQKVAVWTWASDPRTPDVSSHTVADDLGDVTDAAFDGAGGVVFTTRAGSVLHWKATGSDEVHELARVAANPELGPHARFAVTTSDDAVTLTPLAVPGPSRSVRTGTGVTDATLSPDETLLAVRTSNAMTVYRTVDGTRVAAYPLGIPGGGAAAFRIDNRRLAMTDGPAVTVVDVGSGRTVASHPVEMPPGFPAHCCDVNIPSALAWSPNGQALAAGTGDTTIRIWVGESDTPLYLNGDTDAAGGLAFSTDGSHLLSAGHRVEVWDWTRAMTLTYYSDGRPAPPVFSPDGEHVAMGGADGWATVRATHELGTRRVVRGIPLAFGPDGVLAVEEAGAIGVWDTRAGRRLARLPVTDPGFGTTTYPGVHACFDGDHLAVQIDLPRPSQLLTWPFRSGGAATPMPGVSGDGGVAAIVRCADGVVDVLADGALYRWPATRTPELVAAAPEPFFDVGPAAYLNPDTVVLTPGARTVQWDVPRATLTPVPVGDSSQFALSGDKRSMALSGDDGVVYLWDLHGEPVLIGRYSVAPHVALNADGSLLAVADDTGLHLVPTRFAGAFSDVVELARTLVVRPLTADEERQYLPSG